MVESFDRNELIMEGLAYTVMGVVIVFIILAIIMYVIKAMALFSIERNPARKEQTVSMQEEVPAIAAEDKEVEKKDDSELIAVITAAIAAAMGKSASGFVIRSYKKVSGGAWNKAGRREILENRF